MIMKKIFLLAGIFLLAAFFLSCRAGSVPPERPLTGPGGGQNTILPNKAAPALEQKSWEKEWEEVVTEARKEGRVVVHLFAGISPSLRQEISSIMRSRYGLELELIAGRSNELAEKAIREQKAGLYLADLYLAGLSAASAIIKPAGILEPLEPMLILPEVKDPNLWWGGKLPFVDKEKRFIIAPMAYPSSGLEFNSDYVTKQEMESYRDLLNPRWKGKIVMSDPTIGGSGQSWFSSIGLKVMGLEFIRALAKQEPMLTRDLRLQAEWMARGKYPVGIGTSRGIMVEMQRAGVPLAEHIPKEGTTLAAGGNNLVLYQKAPHPSATRVLVNWLLSREGQTVYSKGQDTQSARVDIPADFLAPSGVRQADINYIDTRDEEAWIQMSKDVQIAREIFGIK